MSELTPKQELAGTLARSVGQKDLIKMVNDVEAETPDEVLDGLPSKEELRQAHFENVADQIHDWLEHEMTPEQADMLEATITSDDFPLEALVGVVCEAYINTTREMSKEYTEEAQKRLREALQ